MLVNVVLFIPFLCLEFTYDTKTITNYLALQQMEEAIYCALVLLHVFRESAFRSRYKSAWPGAYPKSFFQ